jgi:hypothetical protein
VERQGETKSQHYVPQFIMRKISKDGRHVSLLALSSGKRIDGAKISKQCKGDYFYGYDQEMEKAFQVEEYKKVSPIVFEPQADGRERIGVAVTFVDVRVGAKLSFIRPTDGHSYVNYEGPTVPPRSVKQVALARAFGEYLEQSAGRVVRS